jgi:general stress protein YciG
MQQHLETDPPSSSPSSVPGDELKPDAPPSSPDSPAPARKRRGFAVMDPKLVSEISRKGGKAAHSAGTAHEFTSDEARAAGRKGGLASHAKRRQAADSSAKPSEPSGER